MLDTILTLPRSPPSLFVVLEGAKLSRYGESYIVQFYLRKEDITYLVDVYRLKKAAFTTPSSSNQTLKMILEDPGISKVFLDVRNDSDTLFAHYSIKICGIYDLQPMEVATRQQWSRRTVNGLARCIENDAGLSLSQVAACKAIEERGTNLFAPEKGGSYEVFRKRPLDDSIMAYCTQDVAFLHNLYEVYRHRLSGHELKEVLKFSEDRATYCQLREYVPLGRLSP